MIWLQLNNPKDTTDAYRYNFFYNNGGKYYIKFHHNQLTTESNYITGVHKFNEILTTN